MPEYYKCYLFHYISCISVFTGLFWVSVRIQWEKQTHWDKYISELVGSSLLLAPLNLFIYILDYLPSDFKLQHQTCRQWPHRDSNHLYNCLRPDLCWQIPSYKFTIQSPKTSLSRYNWKIIHIFACKDV